MADYLWLGSMCSGIGMMELGIVEGFKAEGLDLRVRWQVEKDPYAREVLRRHYPEAQLFEDVNDEQTEKAIKNQPVSVCCFGFPCQDLSYAGHQKGITGERSGLFFRCWELAVLAGAKYIILENVPGVLTNEASGAVLRTISQSGYSAEWIDLSAAQMGARHKRRRWFLVAYSERE